MHSIVTRSRLRILTGPLAAATLAGALGSPAILAPRAMAGPPDTSPTEGAPAEGAPPAATTDDPASKAALTQFQAYVGAWRGVGQPRRGSSRGAWQQETEWSWQFAPRPALIFRSPQGKYFREGRLSADVARQQLQLFATTPDGQQVRYQGPLAIANHGDSESGGTQSGTTNSGKPNSDAAQPDPLQGVVQLSCADPPPGIPHRISLRVVAAGKRLVVLYERRDASERYERLAEVGYTRKGSGFGQGTSYVECVVTGGLGTIPVTHQGQTYYVCCTGCREYFDENPDQVLAEYRERKEQQRREKAERDR
jgi:hypothetical protein